MHEVGDLYGEVVASRSLAIQRRRQQHVTLVLTNAERLLVVTICQSTTNVSDVAVASIRHVVPLYAHLFYNFTCLCMKYINYNTDLY